MSSPNIDFNNIPNTYLKPGKYFEFNTRLAMRALPLVNYNMLMIAQRIKALIEPRIFQGGTLNDMVSGGAFTGTAVKRYRVKITTAAATDKFKWSSDDGATWSAEVSLTGAAQILELGVTVTFGATTGHALNDEWRFNAYPEPTVAEKVATKIFSSAEAATYSGYGSMLHIMTAAAIKANPYLDITAITLDDNVAGVAASATVTLTGPATSAGVVTLYVANVKVEAAIAKDDTASKIATAICNAIAAKPELPVVASNAAGVVTLTAKNKGLCGNDIGLGYRIDGALGVDVTIVAMSNGAANPDPQDALDTALPGNYHTIINPFNNETDITTVRDHVDLVSGPIEQRPARYFYADNSVLADATTLAGLDNSGRARFPYLRLTNTMRKSMPYEIAAAVAAARMTEPDLARPLDGIEVKGISLPDLADRFSRTECETLVQNGVTPLEVGRDGRLQIVQLVSTYTKNAEGILDASLSEAMTIDVLDYTRLAMLTRFTQRFSRQKITDALVKSIRSEAIDVALMLEQLEYLEHVKEWMDYFLAERDSQNVNRVNVRIPTPIVPGLHVIAGRMDLIIGWTPGDMTLAA